MVSLWGSKDQTSGTEESTNPAHADGADAEQSQPPRPHRSEEHTDERSRLLPPRQDRFLDPDDPAASIHTCLSEAVLTRAQVSPYNLWTVRAIRFFAVAFFAITFLWWVLLLVSIFVSPPGMHSRGSGFFDVSYTTLTAANLLVGILFFSIPSKALELTSMFVALLLFIDTIIIVSVAQLRFEEGWVGIASVIWATLMAVYIVISDRVVAWGKGEEEERLTGRRETRRSLAEWLGVFTYTFIMVVIIIVTLLLTATLILRARDASLEAPGQKYFVDDDKYRVHLSCNGVADDAYPTILVEAGSEPYEGTLGPFFEAAYKNGTIQRYCYWDRPGLAFSDNAPSPHSAGMSIDALSEALAQAGELGPYVLVSADIGSIYSRIFSSRHSGDVEGIMLVDPLHEDYLWNIGNARRGFVLWGWGIISPLGLQRLAGVIFHGRTREDRVYGRSANQSGRYIKAKLQENLVATSLTRTEVGTARNIQDKTTPLVVVSSGIKYRSNQEWAEKQEAMTKITNNLVAWDVVKRAPHNVWETLEGRTVMEKRLGQLVKKN